MRKINETFDNLIDDVESLVDRTDLDSVLEALEEMCYLKAEHVREDWQDENLARVWEYNGKIISQTINKIRPTF